MCPDDETHALIMAPRPAEPAESGIPNPKSPSRQAAPDSPEAEPEYVRKAPPSHAKRYRELVKLFKELEAEARAGDHAAQEALRAFAEMWSRAAFIVSSPDRPRGRRKQLAKEFLREKSDLDEC
jgi:hypothetical protein